jgi:flagellar biosynthesis GTPase FlhF
VSQQSSGENILRTVLGIQKQLAEIINPDVLINHPNLVLTVKSIENQMETVRSFYDTDNAEADFNQPKSISDVSISSILTPPKIFSRSSRPRKWKSSNYGIMTSDEHIKSHESRIEKEAKEQQMKAQNKKDREEKKQLNETLRRMKKEKTEENKTKAREEKEKTEKAKALKRAAVQEKRETEKSAKKAKKSAIMEKNDDSTASS